MNIGIHHEGARRTHIDIEQPYVEQVNRKGEVIGPPVPPPGRALCGVRLSWLILGDEPITCPRCLQAVADSIPNPSQGGIPSAG